MIQIIHPPKLVRGVLRIPGDRSVTVRAVLLGAIANGVSVVRDYLECDDTAAAINIMRALGVEIETIYNTNHALRIEGVGLRGLRPPTSSLYADSSGTTLRLLAGLMAGQSFASTLDGSAQLRKRPMRRIIEPLNTMGAQISGTNDCAPLYVQPGALHGIEYVMPVASAQVKSALLLAALYADGDVIIHEAAPTRDHTERMLAAMSVDISYQRPEARTQAADVIGSISNVPVDPAPAQGAGIVNRQTPILLRPLNMTIPADFSSAAFFLVAGVLHPKSRVELLRVGLNPTRTGLLEALRGMGANIHVHNSHFQGGEPVGDLLPVFSELRGIRVCGELTALMIDEFPVFAVAASQARGTTVVRDAQELRVKESNRIDALVDELRKMGAAIEATPDGFVVEGPCPLHGAVVDAHGDHRMAMALSIAGLIADGSTTIIGAECVSKTYPAFFEDLEAISYSIE
ncbi:MAG: 3-phosphoshikimate 1-carboxyvinyltransferase [Chloroflexi bacterium]|nr:3-phosphoshikimate 1-carboxyvinyltransferase [Chloroflexota bacterium]